MVTRRQRDKTATSIQWGCRAAYQVCFAHRWAVLPCSLHNLGIRPEQSCGHEPITSIRCHSSTTDATHTHTKKWSHLEPSLDQHRAAQYLRNVAPLASRQGQVLLKTPCKSKSCIYSTQHHHTNPIHASHTPNFTQVPHSPEIESPSYKPA